MITVSVCMIVKNEEHCLERCLKSLAPVADEIIVVDTGSDDGTKDIAKNLRIRYMILPGPEALAMHATIHFHLQDVITYTVPMQTKNLMKKTLKGLKS